MKDRSEIGIVAATTRYEAWLAERIPLVKPDLGLKHHAMSAGIFPFLRATFYRWAARWRTLVGDVAAAPTVLAVGDLHVENFGTWRDAEGRLVWGVNDFDEAWPLPYTNDLLRLATRSLIAREYHDLRIDGKEAVEAILEGYREALEQGGHAFVLAEHHTALREMAVYRLHDPETFWDKLESLPTVKPPVPKGVLASLRRALPERDLDRAARDGRVSAARSRDLLGQTRVTPHGETARPEGRAGLAATGPPGEGSQGQDRASCRWAREPGAPTVRRARRVARWARRSGSEGPRALGLYCGRERGRREGRDGAARVVGAERREREDPLRRDAAARRPVSRSVRHSGRRLARAAARAGLLARTVERAAAQA